MADAAVPGEDPTTTATTDRFHQLRLRLLAVVGRMRGNPPGKGLFREALNAALGSHKTFRHGGHLVARRDVHHCGWVTYGFCDAGASVRGRSIREIAAEMSVSDRTARACLGVLADRGFLAALRQSRRTPAIYSLSLLIWVRTKIEALRSDTGLDVPSAAHHAALEPSAAHHAALGPSAAHHAGLSAAHHAALRGVRTYAYVKEEEEEDKPGGLTTTTATTATTLVMDDVDPPIEPSPPSTDVPEAGDLKSDPTTVPQLKLIADICGELGVPAPALVTRREAIPVIADLLARRDGSRAAARLEAKGQGRRQKGAAVDRAGYASAAQCGGCETLQYPEPGGWCPGCGEAMRQWEPTG